MKDIKTITKPAKPKAKRVMGIDANTYNLAYCVFYNRRPVAWGKVDFEGKDVYERMHDATSKVRALSSLIDVDYIAFESAILAKVANADVTIKLAMVYGVCISELMQSGTKVVTVKPLEWQSYIGNPNFKKSEKEAVKKAFPDKSVTWYASKVRELRKQKTMDFFNKKWDMNITDNDVGDACGIAYYAYYELTSR